MQRKHFLAFSQHYGLPTNLLDFTSSPLISSIFPVAVNRETTDMSISSKGPAH